MAKFIFKHGNFVSVTGNQEMAFTDRQVVLRSCDERAKTDDGTVESTKNDGYLGTWNYDLEKDSNVYYTVHDSGITEFLAYKQPASDGDVVTEHQEKYCIELNGFIYNCIPEEDDTIYSTYKEARLELMAGEINKVSDAMFNGNPAATAQM